MGDSGYTFRGKEDILNVSSFFCFIQMQYSEIKILHFQNYAEKFSSVIENLEISEVVNSEQKEHREQYYENINIGVNFYELEYERAFGFLGMGIKNLE